MKNWNFDQKGIEKYLCVSKNPSRILLDESSFLTLVREAGQEADLRWVTPAQAFMGRRPPYEDAGPSSGAVSLSRISESTFIIQCDKLTEKMTVKFYTYVNFCVT